MPLFKYRCAVCKHIMEVLEKADADGQHVCEKCGSRHMVKLMATFSVGSAASSGSCPTGTCPLS